MNIAGLTYVTTNTLNQFIIAHFLPTLARDNWRNRIRLRDLDYGSQCRVESTDKTLLFFIFVHDAHYFFITPYFYARELIINSKEAESSFDMKLSLVYIVWCNAITCLLLV